MKVKNLRDLLYKLNDEEEVVLLNDAAPITATNTITQAYMVATPMRYMDTDGTETDGVSNKLILAYSTRERSETK